MTQLEIAIKALEEIRNTQGKVCEIYEICEHVSCSSGYASWVIADQALRLLTQRSLDTLRCEEEGCKEPAVMFYCETHAP